MKNANERRAWHGVAVVLLLLLTVAAAILLPVLEYSHIVQQWLQTFGHRGLAIFIPCYIALAFVAPTTPLTMMAGFAFGWPIGLSVSMLSCAINAALAFLLSRHFFHKRVAMAIDGKPKFKALDRAISDNGWKIIILSQMSPFIPFNIQNLFYGLTNIRLIAFIPATLAGILPGTVFYVYLGSMSRMMTSPSTSIVQWTLMILGLVATATCLWLVSRAARTRFNDIYKNA